MTTNLRTVDLIVLVVYLGGVFAMGCWFLRRNTSTEQFMAAGRRLPGWAVGLSILGTFVSSISFIANPGKSYAANWNPFVFSLSLPIAALVATRFFVPYYRRSGYISAYRSLEDRFGRWAGTYAVVCYLLTQIARVGSILYLVALAMEPLTGWDVRVIILLTGVLVTIYTLVGGIEAVIWTDVVQSVVLFVGMIACAALLIVETPGGLTQILNVSGESAKLSLGSFRTDGESWLQEFGTPTFWVMLLYGLFINLTNFGIDQSYVQRYLTARTDADARRSVWLGALAYVPVSAILFFIGTALFAYYAAKPDLLPAETRPDSVFPHFIATELPVGATGLLVAAVMAAAMSSVDSSLNSSATLCLTDLYQRYIDPDAAEATRLRVLHIATVFWGVVGTGMALAMINVKSALDAWWELAGVFSGGMLGLFLLGFLSRRANRWAAIVGVGVGVVAILWLSLSATDRWPEGLGVPASPFHSLLTTVFGTTLIVVVGFVAAALGMRVSAAEDEPPRAAKSPESADSP